MSRRRRKGFRLAGGRSKKAGLSPGTLVHVGDKRVEDVHIRVVRYDAHGAEVLEP